MLLSDVSRCPMLPLGAILLRMMVDGYLSCHEMQPDVQCCGLMLTVDLCCLEVLYNVLSCCLMLLDVIRCHKVLCDCV